MSGFHNYLTTSGGDLTIGQIQSPNFELSPLTGWSIQKNGNAYFANVTLSGTFQGTDYIVNSAGAFFYTGTPALGNLFCSIASSGGTDTEGNTYEAGFVLYGASGQAIQLDLVSTFAEVNFLSGAAEELAPAQAVGNIHNPGTSETMQFNIYGAQSSVASHGDFVGIGLNSAAKDGSANAFGGLFYRDLSANLDTYATWGSTGFRVKNANAGDSITYQPERNTQVLTGGILVNTTGFSQIGGTLTVGVGWYVVEGQIMISPTGAGGTAGFEFAGGGGFIAGSSGITWSDTIMGNPATNGSWNFTDPAVGTQFSTGTLTSGRRLITFRGAIHVTTAGTLALFATEAGGGSYNINSRTTLYHLYPWGP